MMKDPIDNISKLVTVIVPIYNVRQYLERCIGSIMAQTYKYLEIICVDDGSTDGSGQIIDRMAKKDARIIALHTGHHGVAAARNLALEIATGEYIGFVDSDDYIQKDMFEVLVTAAHSNPVDIVTCSYYLHDSNGVRAAKNLIKVPETAVTTKDFLRYVYERDKYKAVASYVWTKLIKTELIKDKNNKLQIRFMEDLDIGEDAVFLANVYKNASLVLYVNQALYYYVQRDDSASHDIKKHLKLAQRQDAYSKLIEIYKDMNISEDTVDFLTRLYVFRCGKLLETSLRLGTEENVDFLMDMIEKIFQFTSK